MPLADDIARAVDLRQRGQHTAALAILLDLLPTHADHALLQYEIACCYHSEGLENDAIAYYENALSLGLEGAVRRSALLGLGSSYRCVEQYADAVRQFERGMAEYPEAEEFQVFSDGAP